MRFAPTPLSGAFVLEPERREDERGWFGRSWCIREFEEHGLNPRLVQCNISWNRRRGTLRGMHFQSAPWAEAKLVRCTSGGIYDVIIDVRPDSATLLQWFGAELTAENRSALYVPEGFAHGFQTLTDNAEVFYQMSEFYHPEVSFGFRWNDPTFGIQWPACDSRLISPRDAEWPDFHLDKLRA